MQVMMEGLESRRLMSATTPGLLGYEGQPGNQGGGGGNGTLGYEGQPGNQSNNIGSNGTPQGLLATKASRVTRADEAIQDQTPPTGGVWPRLEGGHDYPT